MIGTRQTRGGVERRSARGRHNPDVHRHRTVFFSYRFDDEAYVGGLISLLQQTGFTVLTGRETAGSVSSVVLKRIADADVVLCVMTKDQAKANGGFTTSPWLLEEKGAALALRKPLVLMVEDGVTDYGELQGDAERIHFGERSMLQAALQAIDRLSTLAIATKQRIHSAGRKRRAG